MVGGVEILSRRLHFHEDSTLPEAVGVALRTVRELDVVLECVEHHSVDAEHYEELLQEALRLALLVVGVLPAFLERRCVLADFIP